MAASGLSTIGVLFGYAAETTAGTKPASFTKLTRINSIGEINLDVEQIDSSALEDAITKYISGRADTGGTLDVTVNLTSETKTEWETLITAYAALTDGKKMWFNTYHKDLGSFFVVAQPPSKIPQPAFDQNGLLTVTLSLTIESYEGLDTGIEPA
jgi:hypothetical protein